jgi:uncharacterized coiled-coil protein SlyX
MGELESRDQAVSELKSQLEASQNGDMEKISSKLDSLMGELASREETVADLKSQLETSQKGEIEKMASKLDSLQDDLNIRKRTVAELESELDESRDDNEADRLRASILETLDDTELDDSVGVLAGDGKGKAGKSSSKFQRTVRDVPAYQALRDYDPQIYDGFITKHKKLIKKGYSEKQAGDVLRASQADLIEQMLPKAGDDAVWNYATAIVDQLNYFLLEGAQPCFKLMAPQSESHRKSIPKFTDKTKEREYEVLEQTLRSYDPHRRPPQDDEVWSQFEPILVELIKVFGEENVMALQTSSDAAKLDQSVVCNISRALYTRILKLPRATAANILRWLVSPD